MTRIPICALFMASVITAQSNTPPEILSTLFLRSTRGEIGEGEWVRCGVPLGQAAAVSDLDSLRLETASGNGIPTRFRALSRWGGTPGSQNLPIKWLEMTFAVNAAGKNQSFRLLRGTPARGSVKVTTSDKGHVGIQNEHFTLSLLKGSTELFGTARDSQGREIASPGSGRLIFQNEAGNPVDAGPWELKVESADASAATVLAATTLPGLVIQARIHVTAGSRQVVVDFRMVNPGPYGHQGTRSEHVYFRRLGMTFPMPTGGKNVHSPWGTHPLKESPSFALLQEHRFPTSSIKPSEQLPFQVWSGLQLLRQGQQARGVLSIEGATGSFGYMVERFWENAPKALAVFPDSLVIDLFPLGGTGPHYQGIYGNPWNGKKPEPRSTGAYRFEGARAKSTRIILEIGGEKQGPLAIESLDRRVDRPLHVTPDPGYIHATGAVGSIYDIARSWKNPAGQRFERMMRILVDDAAADNQPSLGRIGLPGFARRGGTFGKQSFFGWFNYGDIPWGNGYCSLHYDWPFVMLLQYLRTGDSRFFETGSEMARHRRDIDQDHDTKSQHLLRGGQFYEKGHWHGNYSKPEPSHTWPIGPLFHYMLTGDEWSLEAALLGRDFIRRLEPWKWQGIWGVRIPGWTAEHMLSYWWFLGEADDLQKTRSIIANVEGIEKKRDKAGGFVLNPRYKPVSVQPWQMNIFFNAVARHAMLTGSVEFSAFMDRMLGFFREHCMVRSQRGLSILAYRYVNPPGLKKDPSIHLAWPMASSFAHAWKVAGRDEDAAMARVLFEGAARYHQSKSGGTPSVIAFRMLQYPGSESKIMSNIGLWGVAPLIVIE